MPNFKLAFDKSSRRIDADGRLHVDRSHISKANVSPYYGNEIPGHETLGLEPNKVYRLLRDPVELERGAPTFARLPILSKHIPVTVDSPQPDLVVGAIGSDVAFNSPYLDADLSFWDAEAIAGIDTDKVRELSCAYRYVPIMEPGEYEGEPYDGRMTEIQGNHLALVEVGRAGSDVIVADHNPFNYRNSAMKMTKLGKALIAVLCAASPVLAADSALPALIGNANRKTFKKDDVKAKLLAMDSDLDPEMVDSVIDTMLDVENDPKPIQTPEATADESPVDKVKALLAGKVDDETIAAICGMLTPADPALDALEDTKMSKEEVGAAMDAALGDLRKSLRQAEEARHEVRDVVGDVHNIESAAEVYGFALDQMKIDREGVEGAAALRALFKVAANAKSVAPTPRIAADAATVDKQFPNLARFGQA